MNIYFGEFPSRNSATFKKEKVITMKKFSYVLVALVFSLTFAVVGMANEQPRWMQTKTKALVEEARAQTKQVSIQELKKAIDADEDMVIFDVRTPREYEVAHIPEALNVSRGLLEFSVWSVEPDQDEKIYVYCKSGARAALATKLLNSLGYKNAVSVTTGMVDWAKSGYPLQTSITDEQIIIIPVGND